MPWGRSVRRWIPYCAGRAHVMAAEPVLVVAQGKSDTWIYVFGSTGRLGALVRQQRCSTTDATARVSIRSGIWPGMPASCRPRPMTGKPALSGRAPAQTDPGACLVVVAWKSLPWPTSKRMRGAMRWKEGNPALSDRDRGRALIVLPLMECSRRITQSSPRPPAPLQSRQRNGPTYRGSILDRRSPVSGGQSESSFGFGRLT